MQKKNTDKRKKNWWFKYIYLFGWLNKEKEKKSFIYLNVDFDEYKNRP